MIATVMHHIGLVVLLIHYLVTYHVGLGLSTSALADLPQSGSTGIWVLKPHTQICTGITDRMTWIHKYPQVYKHYGPFHTTFSLIIVFIVLDYHVNKKTTQRMSQL